MPVNRNRSTSRAQQLSSAQVQAQAATLTALAAADLAAADLAAEEEPMRRYPHPIPMCAATAQSQEDCSPYMNRVLEQLSCQSQLLVDLLGAVNSLTAALLARGDKT